MTSSEPQYTLVLDGETREWAYEPEASNVAGGRSVGPWRCHGIGSARWQSPFVEIRRELRSAELQRITDVVARYEKDHAPQYPRVVTLRAEYEWRGKVLWVKEAGVGLRRTISNDGVLSDGWTDTGFVFAQDVLAVAALLAPRKEVTAFVAPDWLTTEWARNMAYMLNDRGTSLFDDERDLCLAALRRYHEEHLRGT